MSCKIERHRGTARYFFEKVEELELNGTMENEKQMVGGLEWYLTIGREPYEEGSTEDYLTVSLRCCSPKEKKFAFLAKTEFSIMLLSSTDIPMTEAGSEKFCDSWYSTPACLVKWTELLDQAEGYIAEDGSILIEVALSFHLHRLPDFRVATPLCDTKLIVDSREFFVNRHFLACHSPYFDALFFRTGNFQEANKPVLELKDVSGEHFLYCLQLLHCHELEAYEAIVKDLLAIADCYDIQLVRDRCEDLLNMKDVEVSRALRLLYAEKYDLVLARQVCLDEIDDSTDILDDHGDINTLKSFDDRTIACASRALMDAAFTKRRDADDPKRSTTQQNDMSCTIIRCLLRALSSGCVEQK